MGGFYAPEHRQIAELTLEPRARRLNFIASPLDEDIILGRRGMAEWSKVSDSKACDFCFAVRNLRSIWSQSVSLEAPRLTCTGRRLWIHYMIISTASPSCRERAECALWWSHHCDPIVPAPISSQVSRLPPLGEGRGIGTP